MEQFVVFITNHWILSSMMAVLSIALLINEIFLRHTGVKQVSPLEAVQLINHQQAVIFDIQGETSFPKGHILGSERLSLVSLEPKKGSLQKYMDKMIIIVSYSGYESAKIAKQLQEKGCTEIRILEGGIQGWQAAGLPLVKS